jgi:hypothetical protein
VNRQQGGKKMGKTRLAAAITVIVILALIVTRLFGLWPDWMIRLELIVKARVGVVRWLW